MVISNYILALVVYITHVGQFLNGVITNWKDWALPERSSPHEHICGHAMACHKNFGPLKILVWGTKICREMVPPGLNFSKVLVHLWRIGLPLEVYCSGAVKHHAMSKVCLLKCYQILCIYSTVVQRMVIKMWWPYMHGSIIPEADNYL